MYYSDQLSEKRKIRWKKIKKEIQQWLFNFYSPEYYGYLTVMCETWAKEMTKQSKIHVLSIEVLPPPNLLGANIILLENNHFQVQDIGVIFQVVLHDPQNKEANKKGLVYKFGKCKGRIKVEYLLSNSCFNMMSTTPIDFVYEKMPEWVDKGDNYDINDWINYCQRYTFTLSLSIIKWFNVTAKTSQK